MTTAGGAVADRPVAVGAPDSEETRWGLALASLPGIGDRRRQRLVDAFGSARAAMAALPGDWTRVLGAAASLAVGSRAPDWSWVEAQLGAMRVGGARAVTCADAAYPYLLRQIPDPPPLLFIRGQADLSAPGVAIVGTRRASGYGRAMARRLAGGLARCGITVVSGMAHGIDAAAHEGALEAGGATVAVLGCGVDVVYPAGHRRLHRRLVDGGAVASELPMGVRPEAGSFPRRNRVISGLSLGVVVVEAPARSGALITAACALEQGREVFAVPGDVIDGRSAGCHRLLKEGARLVEGVDDILEELENLLPAPLRAAPPPAPPLNLVQASLLARLDARGRQVDDLAGETGLPSAELLEALLQLELAGLVEQLPGKRFARRG
ncbi:MAG: DNA-processing protein DprA [Gemmatimonadota bacterium]